MLSAFSAQLSAQTSSPTLSSFVIGLSFCVLSSDSYFHSVYCILTTVFLFHCFTVFSSRKLKMAVRTISAILLARMSAFWWL